MSSNISQAVLSYGVNPFSFHNKLKTNPKYLNHRVNRRCDDLTETLLLFEEDMFHQRKYLEIMSQHSGSDDHDQQKTMTDTEEVYIKVNNIYFKHVFS